MDKIPEIMMPKFRMIGVAAGAANLSNEFRIPAWKDTIEINNKNGKVMRQSSVVRSIFEVSEAKPGAKNLTT